MLNDAYCHGRSTQRSLARVCAWWVDIGEGIFGIDFENAFGLACRECANAIAGVPLVAPVIEYTVKTNGKTSPVMISTAGTGAGRPTGGPAFNITFETILNQIPASVVDEGDISAYADDALMHLDIS